MVLYNEESKQIYGQQKRLKNFNKALIEIESDKESNIQIIRKDIQSNNKLKRKTRMVIFQILKLCFFFQISNFGSFCKESTTYEHEQIVCRRTAW